MRSKHAAGRGPCAFSLVELMVALAIFVALAAVALPGLFRWSSSFTDDAAESILKSGAGSARAAGMDLGVVMTLQAWVKPDGESELVLVWVSPPPPGESALESDSMDGEAGRGSGAGSRRGLAGNNDQSTGDESNGPAAGRLEERPLRHRKLAKLPAGYSIVVLEEAGLDTETDGDEPAQEDQRERDSRASQVNQSEMNEAIEKIDLVMFLPDGSAAGAKSVSLRRGDAKVAPVEFGMWTGNVTLGEFASLEDESKLPEDEETEEKNEAKPGESEDASKPTRPAANSPAQPREKPRIEQDPKESDEPASGDEPLDKPAPKKPSESPEEEP